jgi:Dodecin
MRWGRQIQTTHDGPPGGEVRHLVPQPHSEQGADVDRRGVTTAVHGLGAPCGLDWFEVTEISGNIKEGAVAHYEVGLKIGFRLEE